MRSLVILSFAAVAGCASSKSSPPQTREAETVRISGATGAAGLRTTSSTVARVDTMWIKLDRIWKALPAVYGTLEIPIERFDAESNTIGNSNLKLYRRLGKVPLTRYLDCGSTQLGPNAESYEVLLTVLTNVRSLPPENDKTVVATTVAAVARPIQFKGDFVRCSSKGALEARLKEVLNVHFAP